MIKMFMAKAFLLGFLASLPVSNALARMPFRAAPAVNGLSQLVGSSQTLLPNGQILVAGGQDSSGNLKATMSLLNPTTGVISALHVQLQFPRAAHTATVLPDGTVLILGGVGQDGNVVSSSEIFDPLADTVSLLSVSPPVARAFHTATLLTDGRVLVAGGVFDSGMARPVQIWDPRGQNTAVLSGVSMVREDHTAALMPDGRVLFSGGQDGNGNALTQSQIFDPLSETISFVTDIQILQEPNGALTQMQASSPEDGAQNVPLNALVSVRFSRPVQMVSISNATLSLQGPNGPVAGTVVAAEGGMLAFITPAAMLLPGSNYTASLAGAVDTADQSVAYADFAFSTAGVAPTSTANSEEWSPSSDWQTHRPPSPYESLPDLQAPHGTTALAGQVLKLNGEPLPQVTLELGNRRTQSDSTGRFLLSDIPTGHQVLIIEGATANSPGKSYGRFEFGDEIKAGVTNKLDFKIWMSLLDTAHEIMIPSPTVKETVLATPTMPGLELRLPPGTVITDSNGKVVTKITITPIPLDRPPFPLPYVIVPTYFTIQPGGAYISVIGTGPKGARLFYPNTAHLNPGAPYAFWNYNPDHNGWIVYGNGHVNASGTEVVPDPKVVIYDFSGAMVGTGGGGTTTQPGGGGSGGDPVDLSSGLFIYNKPDLSLSDVISLTLTRTYRPYDSWSRPFGIGTTHNYEIFIGGDGNGFGTTAYIDLFLPDGKRVHFLGVGSAPPYSSYLSSSDQTLWYGATISPTPINPYNYILPGLWQLQTTSNC
jgi:hypothetical protein